MDGGVIAAQEEAHRQEMMQQVLSPIFFKLKVALRANMPNFRESPISDFWRKKSWSQPRPGEDYLLQSQFGKRKNTVLSSLEFKINIKTFYPTPLRGGGGSGQLGKNPNF